MRAHTPQKPEHTCTRAHTAAHGKAGMQASLAGLPCCCPRPASKRGVTMPSAEHMGAKLEGKACVWGPQFCAHCTPNVGLLNPRRNSPGELVVSTFCIPPASCEARALRPSHAALARHPFPSPVGLWHDSSAGGEFVEGKKRSLALPLSPAPSRAQGGPRRGHLPMPPRLEVRPGWLM